MIKSSLTPPVVDEEMIEHYMAKGRRARSQAAVEAVRALFSASEETPATPLRTKSA